jgi:ribosomal protein S27E
MAGSAPKCPICGATMVWDATAGCYKCPRGHKTQAQIYSLLFRKGRPRTNLRMKTPCVLVLRCKNNWRVRVFQSYFVEDDGRGAPSPEITCPKCGYKPMVYSAATGCYRCPRCGTIVIPGS